MKKLNLLFFKTWIVLAGLFGIMALISLFVAPAVITKELGICFLWALLGVGIGAFCNKLTRQNE
jgi:hypothetical protein